MNYTLYMAAASDDKHAAYSFIIADFSDYILDQDVYIAVGERRFDASYCGHIALQRALRRAAKLPGVISLHIAMEADLAMPVGFEAMGAEPPLYPSLCLSTQRILRRFQKHEFGIFYPEDDGRHLEIAVVDNAIESLEESRTLAGRLKLYRDLFVYPSKIIR